MFALMVSITIVLHIPAFPFTVSIQSSLLSFCQENVIMSNCCQSEIHTNNVESRKIGKNFTFTKMGMASDNVMQKGSMYFMEEDSLTQRTIRTFVLSR